MVEIKIKLEYEIGIANGEYCVFIYKEGKEFQRIPLNKVKPKILRNPDPSLEENICEWLYARETELPENNSLVLELKLKNSDQEPHHHVFLER